MLFEDSQTDITENFLSTVKTHLDSAYEPPTFTRSDISTIGRLEDNSKVAWAFDFLSKEWLFELKTIHGKFKATGNTPQEAINKVMITADSVSFSINTDGDPFLPEMLAEVYMGKDCKHKKQLLQLLSSFTEGTDDTLNDYHKDTLRDGGSIEIQVYSKNLLQTFKTFKESLNNVI